MADQEKNYSKIMVGNKVYLDLSKDTVNPSNMLAGETAHDKQGKPIVGACTFDADTSDATAENGEVLNGATYYKDGKKQTGTMPNNGTQTLTLQSRDAAVEIAYGFHEGGSVGLSADDKAKLISSNIKSGVKILDVEGSMTGAESVTAQPKTATPTFEQQFILPDRGVDYLSQVTVNPIPVSETKETIDGVEYITLVIGS